MKRMKLPIIALAAGLGGWSSFAAESTAPNLNDQKERISYALGVNFGSNLKSQGVDVNLETVRQGIEDALGGKPQMQEEQLRATFNELRTQITARADTKKAEAKAAGEKFLAENKSKPGVVTNASGLQYKVIKEGSGSSPGAMDEVSVKYTGKLIDGTVFDSTDNRGGTPAKFRVNGVIPGWTEALQKMKKGSTWELYIPSNIAYGERGSPPRIPGNSVLVFNVELVDIHPAAPPAAAQQPVTSDIIKVPSAEELQKGAKIEIIKPEDVEKEIAKEKARKEAEQQLQKK
jgi:FKBP-type peptidyl-prolyl cis-trans isomerase FklB